MPLDALSRTLLGQAAARLRTWSDQLNLRAGHRPKTHQGVAKRYLAGLTTPCVYDIGASDGRWAALLLGIRGDAQVHCFEPGRAAFQRLQRRFGADPRVATHAVALGAQDTTLPLGVNRHEAASSLLPPTPRCADEYPVVSLETEEEAVSVRTLDSIVAELNLPPPQFIKLDVQGYEHEVIRGASKTLSKGKVAVCEVSFVELYQNGAHLDEVCHLLRLADYSLAEIYGWSFGRSGEPIQADFVFTRGS